MSIYEYPDISPVKAVNFNHAPDRPPVALLTAAANASPAELSNITDSLCMNHWTCVPVNTDGNNALQVSGFETEQQLLSFLQARQLAKGQYEYTLEAGDNAKHTTREWLRANALKIGGWLNLVGDVGLLASGISSGRHRETTAGALYTAGAAALARYGNVKTEYHVRQVLEKTAEFLKKQAVDMPETCGLHIIMRDRKDGVIDSAERFMYRYPSEVMLGAYTMGALTMLQSGIKHGNPWGVAYGVNSVAVKAASLLIPEKHKTEEEKIASRHQGPLHQFTDWVQEKPLRIVGFGSMVSDVLLGMSAIKDYKNDKSHTAAIFKLITSGTYILADVMLAISNKNHANGDGKFDADEQLRIEALAAEAIARQPKEMQPALVHNVAGFLTTQQEMSGTSLDISKSIQRQLASLQSNPWTSRFGTDIMAIQSNR